MYFDPGSGSIIVQVVLAAIATLSTLMYAFRSKITSIFKKNKKVLAKGDDESDK